MEEAAATLDPVTERLMAIMREKGQSLQHGSESILEQSSALGRRRSRRRGLAARGCKCTGK